MPEITEDDIYRASSQFRLWSFTQESLASLRGTTNAAAADAVRAAIKNLRSQKDGKEGQRNGSNNRHDQDLSPKSVDCLTVDEEQKLLWYYCLQTMRFADFINLPVNVKATAVQYMKRFYISNSPMTYHPKEIMPTAVFLATKTENCYIPLKDFAMKLPKATPEGVIAPEFLLTQGLRFTFDVKHAFRGLEGMYMELLAMANGNENEGPGSTEFPAQLQEALMDSKPGIGGTKQQPSVGAIIKRIEKAKTGVKELLETSAQITDAYFLYTPSQILLSSLFLTDEPLAHFYINHKLTSPSDSKFKLMNILQDCAQLLKSSPSAKPGEEEMGELKRIDKKLYMCRNPEKIDLVEINKAQKREGAENGLDEKVIKKRKLEREKSEKEAGEVFGPALPAGR